MLSVGIGGRSSMMLPSVDEPESEGVGEAVGCGRMIAGAEAN